MSGELAPGTRLIELQIARELNTSQGPVREALCELEGLELIETEPYLRVLEAQSVRSKYIKSVSISFSFPIIFISNHISYIFPIYNQISFIACNAFSLLPYYITASNINFFLDFELTA